MTKTVSFDLEDSDRPKYQRMVERLESGIASGQWKAGDRLPSNRELAVLFGVTIGTVSKAMSEAVRRGIVDTRIGSGTYIREPRDFGLHGSTGAGQLDLSLNVLPVGPVQDLLKSAMTAHAQRQGAASMFAHVDVQQRASLRQAAAEWLTAMGTPTANHEVVLTSGVHHGLLVAFHLLLQPGDVALCDILSYTGFKRIAKLRGVRLVGVAGDAEGMRPDMLEQAIRATGARVLVANPVLQNPTASTMSPDRRRHISAVCRKHDLCIIEDGVAVPLSDPGTPSVASHAPERTIHLCGFSKSVASGFRLGYARVPSPHIDAFREASIAAQWFPPGYYAELLELMHSEGLLERCIMAHRTEALARQQLVKDCVPEAQLGAPGYHAWLALNRSSVELCERLRSEGIGLSSAHHFAVSPEAPDGVRISLGACRDRSELRQGLLALSSALQSTDARPRPAALAPAV